MTRRGGAAGSARRGPLPHPPPGTPGSTPRIRRPARGAAPAPPPTAAAAVGAPTRSGRAGRAGNGGARRYLARASARRPPAPPPAAAGASVSLGRRRRRGVRTAAAAAGAPARPFSLVVAVPRARSRPGPPRRDGRGVSRAGWCCRGRRVPRGRVHRAGVPAAEHTSCGRKEAHTPPRWGWQTFLKAP